MAQITIGGSDRRDYYVYILFRETGIPFYVGKGCGKRMARHLTKHRGDRSKKRCVAEGILARGFDVPAVKIAENLTEAEAFATEIAFIAAIGREPIGPLVNHSDGGPGSANPDFSIRQARRKAMTGRKMSPDAIARSVAKRRGYKHSPEALAKMSAATKGRKASPETRAKMKMRRASAETRLKMSLAHKGRKMPRDVVERLAAQRRGRKMPPDAVAKVAAAKRGKKQSPELVKRRIEAMLASPKYWEGVRAAAARKIGCKATAEHRKSLREAWIRRREKRRLAS